MIVGHAEIVVRALTNKVEGDIRRGFSGSSAAAHKAGTQIGNALTRGMGGSIKKDNSFTRLSDQIKEMYPEADRAANSFTHLMRSGYVAQSGIGALVGSIGALVGGLGALVGSAGAAAGALAGVAGAAVALKVGMAVGKLALGGISQAVSAATKTNGGYSKSLKEMKFDAEEAALGVERAGINLEKAREGLARVSDLAPSNRTRREAMLAVREAELALRKAKDAEQNPDDGKKGGADPFAGLTPAQKDFAKYLLTLQKDFKDLKEAAASGFLPLLQTQMERLIKAGTLEILKKRFFEIGQGLGKAAEKFTDVFLSGDNLDDFDKVLGQIAALLPKFGTILGNVFGGFLSVLRAAEPLTTRFVGFLESKSAAFANFLNTKQATGELTGFFNRAGDVAAKFGSIFGNAFGGLGKIIQANFGPGSGGDTILGWLDEVTLGWKNMDLIGTQMYFKGAADNFVTMGNAMGGAIETVIKAGSNPAIGEFWMALDAGSYAFSQIVTGAVESGPALGRLIQSLAEIMAVFADAGQVIAFFDVLDHMAGGAAEILKAIKPMLDWAGPVIGAVSALGLLVGVMTKLSMVALGFLAKGLAGFGIMLPGALGRSALGAGGLTGAMTAAAGSMQAAAVAMTEVAIASGASIPAMGGAAASAGGLAVAQGTATAATGGLRAALMGLMASNPLGWVVAGIAAVVALGVALAGIHGENMQKASDGVTAAFDRGADAATVWKNATLAVANGPSKQIIGDLDGMKKSITQLGYAQKSISSALPSTTALADSFGAMGRSLANVATTDLPKAQAQMLQFKKQTGLSTREVAIAIDEMDEYKSELKKQAEAMGITIGNTDTYAGKMRLAAFAVGEGEVATRRAAEATAAFKTEVADMAKGAIDVTGPLQQNAKDTMAWAKAQAAASSDASDSWKDYYDGRSFSIDKYIDDIRKEYDANKQWETNINKLTGLASQGVVEFVRKLGPAGAKVAAALVDPVTGPKAIAELETMYATAGDRSAAAFALGFKAALPKGMTMQGLLDSGYGRRTPVPGTVKPKDGGFISKFAFGGYVAGAGTARSDSIPAMISNGEYVVNARATAQNRTLLDAINSNKEVSMAPNISVTVNPSAGMDERALAAQVSRLIAFEIRKGSI